MVDEELAVEQEETKGEELSEEEQAMARLKEAVSVKREDLGGLRTKLTVTVPREILDERFHDQFAELKREAVVPGFRKGHAPLQLVEKRFGADVGEELKGKIVGSGYMAAIEKEDIKALGDPMIWVKMNEERVGEDEKPRTVEVDKLVAFDQALEHLSLPKEGELTFACELELKPEFDLPKLEKIPVEKPTISIEKDDIEKEIERLRMMRGAFEPVEKGAVKRDDLLYAAMKMTVGEDVIATDDNFDIAARDIRVKGVPLEGFGKALTGKKIGDQVTFEADVPDDHENADLRGKKAKFDFEIKEIKRLVMPEIDENFLSNLGYDSEKDLRNDVKAGMEREVDQILNRQMKDQVADYLVDNTKIEIPAGLSQRQTDRSVTRRMIELYQSGFPQAEIEKQMDELRSKAADQVVRDLKLYFVLDKIGEEREVEVTEEEINAAIAQIAHRSGKRFDRVRDELSKGDGMMTLYMRIRDDRILDALLGDAEIKEVEGPKKKASGKATAQKAGGTAQAKKKTPAKPKGKKKAKKDE